MSFWVASAAVFVGNCLLSVTSGRWMLATLQAMTAILAILAAVDEWDRKRYRTLEIRPGRREAIASTHPQPTRSGVDS